MKTLIIGRHESCDIQLDDGKKSISRKHAILNILEDGTCTIEDLDSTNKTYVQSRPLNPHTKYYLLEGDSVSLAGKMKLDWIRYRDMYHSHSSYSYSDVSSSRQTIFKRSKPKTEERVNREKRESTPTPQTQNRWTKEDPKTSLKDKSLKKNTSHQRTVLNYTVISNFFDKIIPIPGISSNIKIFFDLHSKPITKILQLIEQSEEEAEAHPYQFLGFALTIYVGIFAFISKKLEKLDEYNEVGNEKYGFQNIELFSMPTLYAFYFALVIFTYAWVSYKIFKQTTPQVKSFRKFLRMTSLSQGMILIHTGIFLAITIFIGTKIDPDIHNSDLMALFGMFILGSIGVLVYFSLVNIRLNRRFWELSWKKYLPYLFVVIIISGFVSAFITILIELILF